MLSRNLNYFLRKNGSRILQYSTIPAAKQSEKTSFDKYKDLEGLNTILQRKSPKLPQKPPFAKNLLLGIFDTDFLTYPELTKEEVDNLERDTELLKNLTSNENPVDIKEFLGNLHKFKCLGLQSSIDDGGRELNQTEECKYNEILYNNKFKYNLLYNEYCIYILSKYGDDVQKNKYLSKLIEGKILSTVTLGEGNDGKEDKTIAKISADGKNYILNGKKMKVFNAKESDLFIVFSFMEDSVEGSLQENDITGFLVDSTSPGISIENIQTEDPNISISNITFNNTTVPVENLIFGVRSGKKILSTTLPQFHLNSNIIHLNILKNLSKHMCENFLNKSIPGEEIYETEAVTSKLSEILMNTYMVESTIYLTSNLLSKYENQDCELEALLTRVLASELTFKSTQIGFSMIGTPALDSKHFCQKIHKEALTNSICFESEDNLKILISLLGVQYAGANLGETIKKLRNPMFNPNFIMKRVLKDFLKQENNPKLTIQMKNYLHLTCQDAANQLEYCVLRLPYVTESLLTTYGIDVLNRHCHLRRLAEVLLQIYAMTACLGRASRSYCIGLEHADKEIVMANVICSNGFKIVKQLLDDMYFDAENPDKVNMILTENFYKNRNYYFSPPLERNF